jgi:hypothetical protein
METGDRMALAQVYATVAVAGQLAGLTAEVNLARGELANIRAVLENRSPCSPDDRHGLDRRLLTWISAPATNTGGEQVPAQRGHEYVPASAETRWDSRLHRGAVVMVCGGDDSAGGWSARKR